MKKWFKSFQIWVLQWANTKWGLWVLFICAFADASFLPLPTPLFFLALALLNLTKAYKYALFATLGMLSGAIVGYTIGHFAWITVNGEFTGIANFFFNNVPGFSEEIYSRIQNLYAKWDIWILFIAAILPLPYKIFSISSGVFDVNIIIFCIVTLISQGLKFFLLAFLTIKLGTEVKRLLEFNWKPVAIIITACIVLIIVLFKVF
jgi:membrane protein YqaA with SNARE-associated domain